MTEMFNDNVEAASRPISDLIQPVRHDRVQINEPLKMLYARVPIAGLSFIADESSTAHGYDANLYLGAVCVFPVICFRNTNFANRIGFIYSSLAAS